MQQTETGFFYKLRNIFSERSSEGEQTADPADVMVEETMDLSPEDAVVELDLSRPVMLPNEAAAGDLTREIKLRTVTVPPAKIQRPGENDFDLRFASSFVDAGGKFIYCESVSQGVEAIRKLSEERGWHHVFCWENEIKDAFCENNFQKGAIGFTIENSEAAVSLCESLIAEDGNIVLNPKQASRRRLPCFPKTHIVFTDISHLAANRLEALERFYYYNKNELPSIINLRDNTPGQFYDQSRLILKADGTTDLFVILIDEIIPPSLRP